MPCEHGYGEGPLHCRECNEELARELRQEGERSHPILKYLLNILIAIDQLGNAILFGDPDETISSRCAKILHHAAENNVPAPWAWHALGRFLEKIDPGHLKRSLEYCEGRNAVFKRGF